MSSIFEIQKRKKQLYIRPSHQHNLTFLAQSHSTILVLTFDDILGSCHASAAWKSVTQKKMFFEYAKVLKHGRPLQKQLIIQSTPGNRLQEGSNPPASYHSPTSHRSAPFATFLETTRRKVTLRRPTMGR